MGFADGHGVVGEVDIAVVACEGNLLANVILRISIMDSGAKYLTWTTGSGYSLTERGCRRGEMRRAYRRVHGR